MISFKKVAEPWYYGCHSYLWPSEGSEEGGVCKEKGGWRGQLNGVINKWRYQETSLQFPAFPWPLMERIYNTVHHVRHGNSRQVQCTDLYFCRYLGVQNRLTHVNLEEIYSCFRSNYWCWIRSHSFKGCFRGKWHPHRNTAPWKNICISFFGGGRILLHYDHISRGTEDSQIGEKYGLEVNAGES